MSTTTITSLDQFEAIPVDGVVSITRNGSPARQRYIRVADGWRDLAAENNPTMPGRVFRGAIEAGTVRLVDANEVANAAEARRWQIGDWWGNTTNSNIFYWVTNEDKSGAVHNCIVVQNGSASRGVLNEQHVTSEDHGYYRIEEPDALVDNTVTKWFIEGITAAFGGARPSNSFVESIVAHANANEDEVLFGVLAENGVDTSVTVEVTIEGTSRLSEEAIAVMVGAGVTVDAGAAFGWSKAVPLRFKRGCLCSKEWETQMVNSNDLNLHLPSNKEPDFSVSYDCPIHG